MAAQGPRLPPLEEIAQSVRVALAEDIGSGDRTAKLLDSRSAANARVVARESGIVCGRAWFDEVYRQLDAGVKIHWQVQDGTATHADQTLCELHGPARALLTGERTALNFLQLLSGTATTARRYADAVRGTGTIVLDTRKTVPGLRRAQKYAVACGGCQNHRMGLYDAILIKENHIRAAGSIRAAIAAAKANVPGDIPLEVEVEDLDQLQEALAAGADRVLLDNFGIDDIRTAVEQARRRATLEVSGGVTLENIRTIAETGVDFISVGDLTKNLKALDLSMRFY